MSNSPPVGRVWRIRIILAVRETVKKTVATTRSLRVKNRNARLDKAATATRKLPNDGSHVCICFYGDRMRSNDCLTGGDCMTTPLLRRMKAHAYYERAEDCAGEL
jgi:hypothetical protein